MRLKYLPFVLQFVLAVLGTTSIARSDAIDDLVERRDNNIAFLGEIVAEVERYTDMAIERRRAASQEVFNTFREDSAKAALKELLERRKAGQLILHPEILRTLRPNPLLLVVYEGFSLGWTVGEIQAALQEASIFDAQVEADLKRIERINKQITELDLQIASLYLDQARAQNTLSARINAGEGISNSDYGVDFGQQQLTLGPNPSFATRMACSVASTVDPNLFGCPEWHKVSLPSSSGEPLCVCHGVPLSSPVPAEVSLEAELEQLRDGTLGMTDELAEEVVSFCDQNPSALTCLPPSDALRFGAYCEGPNALPDCGSPLKVGRIGGYCEGPNPLPDCLPTTSGD